MTAARPRSLLLSALIGLLMGILLSGLLLFVLALRTRYAEFDCGGPAVEDCMLERAVALEWSGVQALLGVGLTMLGFGGLLWQRSVQRRQGAAADQPNAEG